MKPKLFVDEERKDAFNQIYNKCFLARTGKELYYFCKKCKCTREHLAHGFRDHNYRETCKKCGEINYEEYD